MQCHLWNGNWDVILKIVKGPFALRSQLSSIAGRGTESITPCAGTMKTLTPSR